MKKTLSLVLALVMILGSFSTVFAATPVTTEAEAGAFLKAAGVLVGDEKGDLNLKDNLLRQDAVILVAQLRGEIKAAQEHKGLPTYEDVKIKFYNAPLAWAQENGLFVGHSDKVFGFGENLTAQEYAKVLLSALGYKVAPNGDSDIKWADALTKAQEFGILENLKVENSTEISRGEMALMTFNALGVNMKGSKETLADKLGIEMPVVEAKELKAEVKDTENLKEVVVELSNAKLADADKLENINNYKIVDHEVEKVEVKGNDVIVSLKGSLLEGREYKLRIRSIDKAIDKEYKFVAKDNASPKVEKVEGLGEYGIKVTTSEPVKVLDTDRGRSFVVDGKNIAMNVEVYGRELILTPYYNESFSKDTKTLTISGLEDFAGYKSAREEFKLEIVKDEVAPKVVDVILRGNNKVEVVFDKDVYADTVEAYANRNNVGNISYVSGRHNIYATDAKKIDTNKVVYTFADELLRVRTDFTIVDVANHSKKAMEKTTMMAREILDNIEPEIFKHEIKNDEATREATIKLFFDKDVEGNMNSAKTQFVLADHFAVYEREVYSRNKKSNVLKSAEYDKDAKGNDIKDVIVVKLENLVKWDKVNELDYILEVENFSAINSRRNNKMFRDYVEFKFQGKTGFNIVANGVKVSERANETHITLTFNKAVDRVIAEERANYIFKESKTNGKNLDVKDLSGRIVTERDGKEVTIILPDFKVADYSTLRILDTLKDKDGNRLSQEYVYDFVLEHIAPSNYSVALVGGKYVVTPNAGVNEINLETNKVGTFVINSNLNKLVINAPNAHVEINSVVGEVEVKAIAGSSLEINGTVGKLVVSSDKAVRVFGTAINNLPIFSTVTEATVNVSVGSTDTPVSVKVKKDNPVKVAVNGTTVTINPIAANVEAAAIVERINTSSSGITLNVGAGENAETKAVDTVKGIVDNVAYEVTVVSKTTATNKLYMVFEVKEKNNTVNRAITREIEFTIQ